MKQIKLIPLFLSLFFASLYGSDLICSDYTAPGEVLNLFIQGETSLYQSGEVTLTGEGGTIQSRSRFFILPVTDSLTAWTALLGIPTELDPGDYTVTCRMESEEGVQIFQKKVGLSQRDFPSEELALNSSLSTIRTKEDPLKTAQAQQLWSVFASFESSHVYTTGTMVKPMDEHRTTTRFGTRRVYLYSNGQSARSIHNGEDWAAPTGTPIKSVGTGRIVMAEERIVTGNTVIIELLPGVLMVYYHLDEILVKEGDMVDSGQVVGRLGMTGLATGPHLHWELRVSRVAVDPLSFLEGPLIDKTQFINIMSDTL